MRLEQVAPAPVAEPRRELRRADDVREQDRREHPIRLLGLARAGDELPDLRDGAIGVEPGQVVAAGQFDVARAGEVRCQPAGILDVAHPVARRMHDQGRHVDRRDHVAHVDVERHPGECLPAGRRRGVPLGLAPPRLDGGQARVIRDRRDAPGDARARAPDFRDPRRCWPRTARRSPRPTASRRRSAPGPRRPAGSSDLVRSGCAAAKSIASGRTLRFAHHHGGLASRRRP